ncbi:MAG: flagellar brake protein [Salinispira sp.]
MGIIFVGLVILMLLSGKYYGSSMKTGSIRHLKKTARNHGLEPYQIHMLLRAIKDQGIANPIRLFHNMKFLSRTLQRLTESVKSSNISAENKEKIIADIFEMRRKIEQSANHLKYQKNIGKTRLLKLGQEVTIYAKGLPPGTSRVIANLDSCLVIEMPHNINSSPIQYTPGTPLKIRLIVNRHAYIFETRLKEFQTVDGVACMLLAHSTKMTYNQLRKHQRKQANVKALFQVVDIVSIQEGDRIVKRATVKKDIKYPGKIEDISKVGCALSTRNAFPVGSLIKIIFRLNPSRITTAFGKVRSIKKQNAAHGVTMGIVFTRVSTKNLNEIQDYVYDFSDY